jgi:cytoskeleton protein RodZ
VDTLGQLLRGAREARGETLDDVERVTRIRARHLSAIEADDLGALASPAQARGFIKNYAQHLGLDIQDVLERYEAAQKKRPPTQPSNAAPKRRDEAPPARGASWPPRPPLARAQPGAAAAAKLEPAAAQARTAQVQTRRPRLVSADVLVATVITLLLVALLVWGGSKLATGLAAATVTPTASFAAGLTTAEATASLTPVLDATATLDLPSPAASYSGVNVTVRAELRSWVRVKVDGAETFAGLMPPGEAREFVGQGVVEVVTGNGKGMRIVYNGVDQGVMGELGAVVDRLWTLQGMVIPTPTITPVPSITPTPSKTP